MSLSGVATLELYSLAAVPLFGITQVDSRGHAVVTILIGTVAMLFTSPAMTKIIGGIWLLMGIVIAAVATRGSRTLPPMLAPGAS
jgi:hypothetical protein